MLTPLPSSTPPASSSTSTPLRPPTSTLPARCSRAKSPFPNSPCRTRHTFLRRILFLSISLRAPARRQTCSQHPRATLTRCHSAPPPLPLRGHCRRPTRPSRRANPKHRSPSPTRPPRTGLLTLIRTRPTRKAVTRRSWCILLHHHAQGKSTIPSRSSPTTPTPVATTPFPRWDLGHHRGFPPRTRATTSSRLTPTPRSPLLLGSRTVCLNPNLNPSPRRQRLPRRPGPRSAPAIAIALDGPAKKKKRPASLWPVSVWVSVLARCARGGTVPPRKPR
jgi:hypothetical protein